MIDGTAEAISFNRDEMCERARALAARAPDAFTSVAMTPEIRRLDSRLPARLVDAVAERAQWCARALAP